MSHVIYHTFNKSDLANTEKVFTRTDKTGKNFLCVKFNAILKIRNNTEKNLEPKKRKTSFELLQEIMDKINEK